MPFKSDRQRRAVMAKLGRKRIKNISNSQKSSSGKESQIIKLKKGWKRIKMEERANVYRWYETKNITASIVQNSKFENEIEYRISTPKDSFIIRGLKNKALQKSDSQNIEIIERHINRDKILKRMSKKKNIRVLGHSK